MCAPSKTRLARSRSKGLVIRSFMNSWWADERQSAGETENESAVLWRASCVCGDLRSHQGPIFEKTSCRTPRSEGKADRSMASGAHRFARTGWETNRHTSAARHADLHA